jgi:hypothetical protein
LNADDRLSFPLISLPSAKPIIATSEFGMHAVPASLWVAKKQKI